MRRLRVATALTVLLAFTFQLIGSATFGVLARARAQAIDGITNEPLGALSAALADAERLLGIVKQKSSEGADTSTELRQLQTDAVAIQAALAAVEGRLETARQALQTLVDAGQVEADTITQLTGVRTNLQSAFANLLSALGTR